MKAIYFSYMPQLFEDQKKIAPSAVTMMGGRLFPGEVLEALLEHSTFDRIVLPEQTRVGQLESEKSPLFTRYRDRILFFSEHGLAALQQFESVVFMSPTVDLAGLARLRQISGCLTAPATGIIHSINSASTLRLFMLLSLCPLTSSDALICSSSAGRTAVENYNSLLMKRLKCCGWHIPAPEYRTPEIPLGIKTADYRNVSSDSLRSKLEIPPGPVVLYMGRFSFTSKADLVPLLLEFGKLLRRHPETTLLVAGDDTQHGMADELESIARRVSPCGRIRILADPDKATKHQLYALADIFVSPSDSLQETFGLTLIEAMSAGLPVVASDWNGYKDLIVNGETGFRAETRFPVYPACFDELRGSGWSLDVDLLAATTVIDWRQFMASISRLISDTNLRKAMGKAAQEKALRTYDWSVVVASYEHLWRELAAESTDRDRLASRPNLDLDRYSYLDIFAHYPTAHLSLQAKLQLAELECLEPDGLSLLAHIGWFSVDTFARVLQIVKEHGVVSIETVLRSLAATDESKQVSHLAHVSRLLKYGYLDLVPATEDVD